MMGVFALYKSSPSKVLRQQRLYVWGIIGLSLLFSAVGGCQKSSGTQLPNVIQININQRDQLIEGLGGFGGKQVWWKPGPYYDAEFLDLLVDDLGLTILRDSLPWDFEIENDNPDPWLTDFSAYPLTHKKAREFSSVADHFAYLKALHQRGLERLMVSIWTPPLWMKHNRDRGNALGKGQYRAPAYVLRPEDELPGHALRINQLRKDMYLEFAEYCANYIKLLKLHTGIDLYAISLQNEPRFSQWYESAVLDPEAMSELIAVVGRYFKQQGITTAIVAPEDMASGPHVLEYIDAIAAKPDALAVTKAIAVHSYKFLGQAADDPSPKYWSRLRAKANEYGLQLWMTETSGYEQSHAGRLALAQLMFSAFRFGHINSWIYWQMSESKESGYLSANKKMPLYYVAQHFYKHIRPGDQQLALKLGQNAVQAVAMISADEQRISVIVLNTSEENKAIQIAGIDAYKLDGCYLSSSDHNYATEGCDAGNSVSRSLMSLVYKKRASSRVP